LAAVSPGGGLDYSGGGETPMALPDPLHDPMWFLFIDDELDRVGTLRTDRIVKKRRVGIPDKKVDDTRTNEELDFLSVRAHYATCRWQRVFFDDSVTYRGSRGHVIPGARGRPSIEIRTTVHYNGHMIFGEYRPEVDGDVVVLFIGRKTDAAVGAVGWLWRHEFGAKSESKNMGYKDLRAVRQNQLNAMRVFPVAPLDVPEPGAPPAASPAYWMSGRYWP
jgi:hypothetical protein